LLRLDLHARRHALSRRADRARVSLFARKISLSKALCGFSTGSPPAPQRAGENRRETRFVAGEDQVVSGVAARYASALFELAEESGATDRVKSQLDTFVKAVTESPDLARLVRSPVFTADEQVKALGALLPKFGIDGITANFFKLMASNRRLFVAPDTVAAFAALIAAKRGGASAEITSAEPLTDAQAAALKNALAAATGKDVAITTAVDQSLIGGLVVKLGSRMIDTSLKTKLAQLKIALKEVR
jgi:F-type H+-transporting ATPase subunit delta